MSVRETRRRQYTQHVIGRHDVDSMWRMKDRDTRRGGGGGGRGSGVSGRWRRWSRGARVETTSTEA